MMNTVQQMQMKLAANQRVTGSAMLSSRARAGFAGPRRYLIVAKSHSNDQVRYSISRSCSSCGGFPALQLVMSC
jgi:hypothetical protein